MYIGAIDIGGTKTIVGILTESGAVLIQKQSPTEQSDCEATFNRCAQQLTEISSEYGISVHTLDGIGVSLPATVESKSGALLLAPGAGWRNFPARDYLRRRLSTRRLWCDNDANNCARAELRFGKAPRDFLWLTVSTGIGGAIIADGCAIRGCNNLAGELGHYKVEVNHPLPCPCGSTGCLEAHASGSAISGAFLRLLNKDPDLAAQVKTSGLPANAAGCAALAKQGCSPAQEIFGQAAVYLGKSLAPVVSILNPERVYLGGGVALSADLLIPKIRETILYYAAKTCSDTEICATALGYNASLLGAAALFLECSGQQ